MGPERRKKPSPWKAIGIGAGGAAAVLTAVGMMASFLRPSLVAALDAETATHAKGEVRRLDERLDQIVQKLDDLPERVAVRMRHR